MPLVYGHSFNDSAVTMPYIYCEKCRHPQQNSEKVCEKCGTPYGGSPFLLVLGIIVAIGGPVLVLLADQTATHNAGRFFMQALFYWILPVIIGSLCLYDSNGKRVSAYFYGGAILIVLGVLALNR